MTQSRRGRRAQPNRGVQAAIDKVESQVTLAAILQVSQPAIHHFLWVKCPVERAIEIERKIGIPRHLTRPDIFSPGEP